MKILFTLLLILTSLSLSAQFMSSKKMLIADETTATFTPENVIVVCNNYDISVHLQFLTHEYYSKVTMKVKHKKGDCFVKTTLVYTRAAYQAIINEYGFDFAEPKETPIPVMYL